MLGRRPGLAHALDLVRKKGADLIVTDGTRLFRNLDAYDDFAQSFSGQVHSIRDGGIVAHDDLRRIISSSETTATSIRKGTQDALDTKKKQGVVLGSPKDLSRATGASARSRREASQELVESIADILEEDKAYSALSHEAFASLLNRRLILTTWKREWTAAGVRRHRRMAEESLAVRRELEAELDAEGLSQEKTPEDDETEMRKNPHFDMF